VVLKIVRKSANAMNAVYALAGEVTADQLPRLETLVCGCLDAHRRLTLDMKWVWRLDPDSAAFFRTGPGRDVNLVSLPEGLAEWLRSDTKGER
jgi:hypothetical protein